MERPLHKEASSFHKEGLFRGLASFHEFEGRIANLDGEKHKGDAFEVFAEAYLATQRRHDVAHIFPLNAIPVDILQKLGISTNDFGIDGIFQTILGHFSAYQVKFRADRKSLTWRELSTFIGLADSPHIHSRVLITNCDELPSILNTRHGFFCIRGSDLDRLDAKDFCAIEAWIADSAIRPVKKEPHPHQREALDALFSALQKDARVSAIMACGAGKTLVALWLTEQMKASSVLVLMPSLALLRQTLHEWLHETRLPALAYLCVCSDPTVQKDADAIVIQQSDLDFEVSTDAQTVRAFLDAQFAGTKVVFSTYQSARVVGEAMKPDESFDFGIFDEAHKTAGREDRNCSFTLDDKNLRIRKRLFLTATPRHYDIHKRNKEGDAKIVYSMDAPEIYGPVAYKLPFAEAARREIICDYKVIISVITSDMINDEMLKKGKVVVKGDEINARQVANQLALKAAVEKHTINKIFTFHSTVAAAKSFVGAQGNGGESISNHLADFACFHVNGAMNVAEREGYMRAFRAAPKAIMSNAHCLTEGVDVPAVDMVAFLSPRRSKVDIVQATGRTMRKSENKIIGHILIPLFVELDKGETIEQAVQRSDMDEVWNILQALQEQDDVLADIIRQMREDYGRSKGFDDSRFHTKAEVLGPTITLDALSKAITVECIKQLGASWDENYGELKAFKERFGHCNVSLRWKENAVLGRWVVNQRQNFRRGKGEISSERIARLDELGFTWSTLDEQWELMFKQLEDYKNKRGNCLVPRKCLENPPLGFWLGHQRRAKKDGILNQDKAGRLEKLGVVWNADIAYWETMFAALLEYKKAMGGLHFPMKFSANPQLNRWVKTQRTMRRFGKLNGERIRRLDDIGFQWKLLDTIWETRFLELLEYKNKKGDCNVPQINYPNRVLSKWVSHQRTAFKKGLLDQERVQRLTEVGFDWDALEKNWDQMFARLADYITQYGHGDAPNSKNKWGGDLELARWAMTQRKCKKENVLSEQRIRRLNEIGFQWDPLSTYWEKMFSALVEYKELHGNCKVPAVFKENQSLGSWIRTQRSAKKKGMLSEERVRRLDEIGFEWNVWK